MGLGGVGDAVGLVTVGKAVDLGTAVGDDLDFGLAVGLAAGIVGIESGDDGVGLTGTIVVFRSGTAVGCKLVAPAG